MVVNYLKNLVAKRQHTLTAKFKAFLSEKLFKVKLEYQVIENQVIAQICKGGCCPQSFGEGWKCTARRTGTDFCNEVNAWEQNNFWVRCRKGFNLSRLAEPEILIGDDRSGAKRLIFLTQCHNLKSDRAFLKNHNYF